jgi:hypothetical protein
MSAPFAAMWRPGSQPVSTPRGQQQQQQGREGANRTQPASGAGTPPLTPAAAHPPQRAGPGARGQQ